MRALLLALSLLISPATATAGYTVVVPEGNGWVELAPATATRPLTVIRRAVPDGYGNWIVTTPPPPPSQPGLWVPAEPQPLWQPVRPLVEPFELAPVDTPWPAPWWEAK